MAAKLRTISEIRRDAALKTGVGDLYLQYCKRRDRYYDLRARLRYPSERLGVVLEFFGVSKLSDLASPARDTAEAVAANDPGAVIRFSEHAIGEKLSALGADALVNEFVRCFRQELEREIKLVKEMLLPAYQIHDCEMLLDGRSTGRFGDENGETAPPIRILRRYLEGATPCSPGLGETAIEACFRSVFK